MTQRDAILSQLHQQNVFRVYDLDEKNQSYNFLEPQFLHYKITIPSPYVYAWKHGIDIEVLNTHAVPSKSVWWSTSPVNSHANGENLIYYYIPGNRHTNYLISLKREFTVMLNLPLSIDYSAEMENTDTYQLFKEFESKGSIESEVNTAEIVKVSTENESRYEQIRRIAQLTIANAWRAWSVKASVVHDTVKNSHRRMNMQFQVTMTIIDVKSVKAFLDNVDMQGASVDTLYDSLVKCINDMVATHKPIRVPYDVSEVFDFGAYVSDIQRQLSEYIQTRTRAYGVTSIVQLHIDLEHSNKVKEEIRVHLTQFRDKIRDIVDYWTKTKNSTLIWEYDESGKVDTDVHVERVAMMQLYLDYLRLMVSNGHSPVPPSEFLERTGRSSDTLSLLPKEPSPDIGGHVGVEAEPS